jgi:polyphenol oxidase
MTRHSSPSSLPDSTQFSDRPTRRQVLMGAGLALCGATAPFSSSAQSTRLNGTHEPASRPMAANARSFAFQNEPPRRRKSFYDLSDQELQNLCLAVSYMRNGTTDQILPLDSPLQWDQYAMIHGHHCTEVGSGSEQVHWSWFFLPWHRAYLFFIERILANFLTTIYHQDSSTFALPYWDWTLHKEIPNTQSRELLGLASPLFGYDLTQEDMVNADKLKFDNQALWDGYRAPTIHKPQMDPANELSLDSKEHIEETIFFMSADYIQTYLFQLPFEMFAGRPVISQANGMGALEHYPHNNGHDWVGSRYGKNRDMGTLRYAALDPIFYMHHANIDRIWSLYPGQQPDPTASPWGAQQYTFVDIDGSPVTVTVKDIITQMTNVTYAPPANTSLAALDLRPQASKAAKKAPTAQSETLLPSASADLLAKPLTLSVPAAPKVHALFAAQERGPTTGFAVLSIETGPIAYDGKFTIRIYVNQPDATRETRISDPHYAGRIHVLASEGRGRETDPAITHNFDVIVPKDRSAVYQAIRAERGFKLTLVPVGPSAENEQFKIPVKSVKVTLIK